MEKLNIEIPNFGELKQIDEDLYWTQFELPFRLNHVNLFFLVTNDGWLIIDSGLKSDHSYEMWNNLLNGPMRKQKICGLIITHYHPDHMGMAGWLQKKYNVPAYTTEKELFTANKLLSMSEEEYSKLFNHVFQRAGMPLDQKNEMLKATRLYKNRVYELPKFEIIKKGKVFNSKNGKWIVRTDSGHSPEHISMFDEKRKLYLAGDFLLPRISPNISDNFFDPKDDRLGGYLTYLNDIKKIGSETLVFPCHDWPFKKGNERADNLIRHHENRLNILKNEMAEKKINIMNSIDLIFDRKIGNEQMHFAIGEARAHLIHLESIGFARSETDLNEVVWYQKN